MTRTSYLWLPRSIGSYIPLAFLKEGQKIATRAECIGDAQKTAFGHRFDPTGDYRVDGRNVMEFFLSHAKELRDRLFDAVTELDSLIADAESVVRREFTEEDAFAPTEDVFSPLAPLTPATEAMSELVGEADEF